MDQMISYNQNSLRNFSSQANNPIQQQIMNMNEIQMKDGNSYNLKNNNEGTGTELVIKNKCIKFGDKEGKLNTIMLRGNHTDIGNALSTVVKQMVETGQYVSTIEMLNNLKKINQFGNEVNIKEIIDENNTNICKFVVDITRGVAEYVKNGFMQLNEKINMDNMNMDLTINNVANELNDLWKYLNNNVYNDFTRLKNQISLNEGKKEKEMESVKNLESLMEELKNEIKIMKEEKLEKEKEFEQLKNELKEIKNKQNEFSRKSINFTSTEKVNEIISKKINNVSAQINKNQRDILTCNNEVKELKEKDEELDNKYLKITDDLSAKMDIIDEKIKIKKNNELFKTTKYESNVDNLELLKCKANMESISNKVNNLLDKNEIIELISKEIEKENIIKENNWKEISNNLKTLNDFRKKGLNDFSSMNERLNKLDTKLDKIDLKFLEIDKLNLGKDEKKLNNIIEKMKNKIMDDIEKVNLVNSTSIEDNITKKIEEVKKVKEDYVEKRIKNLTDGWNKIVNRLKTCEEEIKEIKDNKEEKEDIEDEDNTINTNKKKEDNNNNKKTIKNNALKKSSTGKNKNLKAMVENKIIKNKLKFCSNCLGGNHTTEKCLFKNSKPCNKCGFFHIGCKCFTDKKGLILYYTFKKRYTKVAEIIKKRNNKDIFIKNYKIIKPIRKTIWRKRMNFKKKEEEFEEDKEEEILSKKDF